MNIREIIIHHTASNKNRTTLQDINNWHKVRWANFVSSLGWHIGYHFVITGDGMITQTRKKNEIGAHCPPNEGRLGIVLCGNFETEMPNPLQLNSLEIFLKELKEEFNLSDDNIFAHCEKNRTLCPGKNMIDWLNAYRKLSFLKRQILKLQILLKGLIK